MAKYYHDCETDEIISLEDLHNAWEEFREDGTFSPEEIEIYADFNYYAEACMYYNNGTLTPLRKYIENVRTNSSYLEDPDEIEEVNRYISKLEAYESEV